MKYSGLMSLGHCALACGVIAVLSVLGVAFPFAERTAAAAVFAVSLVLVLIAQSLGGDERRIAMRFWAVAAWPMAAALAFTSFDAPLAYGIGVSFGLTVLAVAALYIRHKQRARGFFWMQLSIAASFPLMNWAEHQKGWAWGLAIGSLPVALMALALAAEGTRVPILWNPRWLPAVGFGGEEEGSPLDFLAMK